METNEVLTDLRVAEQVNWILNYFDLNEYDWRDDQNEISTQIESIVETGKKLGG